MQVIEVKSFSGYGGLQPAELREPRSAKGWLPVRREHPVHVRDAIDWRPIRERNP
jgi:hypothetical protein